MGDRLPRRTQTQPLARGGGAHSHAPSHSRDWADTGGPESPTRSEAAPGAGRDARQSLSVREAGGGGGGRVSPGRASTNTYAASARVSSSPPACVAASARDKGRSHGAGLLVCSATVAQRSP